MLQAFICYYSYVSCYDACVCVVVVVIVHWHCVQRNLACLTWKSAIEIKSLLLLLLSDMFLTRQSCSGSCRFS